MSRIILHSLHHEPEHDAYERTPVLADAVEELGVWVGDLARRHGAARGAEPAPIVICSTTISDLLYDCDDLNRAFRCHVERESGAAVDQIISTYECASWGFALRYLARRGGGPVTLIIMDVNLPHFAFWGRDQVWGRSGHGVAVLGLELAPGFAADFRVGCAAPGRGLFEFVRALQSSAEEAASAPIFVPFLTPAMRPVIERTTVCARVAPNLYDRYGHCFGSDPWIGLIDRLDGTPEARPERVVVGSFALNGYYCLAHVALAQ